MTFKRAISVLLSMLVLSSVPIYSNAEDLPSLDTSYTGFDSEPAVIYNDDLSYDFSLDIASVVISFELEKYNDEQGFALKMVVNDMTDSNDYYFLTLATNSWAMIDTGYGVVNNPIEPSGEGVYNIKFDVSELGEMTNIKLNLWQGTAKINGVAYLDKNGKTLKKDGEIKAADKGCYIPGKGKVSDFIIEDVETATTESPTETVTINTQSNQDNNNSESIMSKRMPFLFNLLSADILGVRIVWILVVIFLLLGVGFITAAVILTRKRHTKQNVSENSNETEASEKKIKKNLEKKSRAPRDIEKRG